MQPLFVAKKYFIIIGILGVYQFSSCTKDKVESLTSLNACDLKDSVSFKNVINPILTNNCMPCHQTPGTGGINLDAYTDIKNFANSGQLVQSIIHDTNYIIMPPPPQKELDSCQVKAIKNWILQGCQNN